MSNMKTLIVVGLAALPATAAAHGVEFHTGFGFWHDIAHIAPFIIGGALAATMIFAFVRWQDTTAG